MNNKKSTSTLLMLIIVVAVVMLTTLGIVLADNYNDLAHGQVTDPIPDETDNNNQQADNNDEDDNDNDSEQVKEIKPDSVNALLIGFDKSNGLTDVVMVAHLDTETNEVKLISLPRDLFIDFRQDEFQNIKKENKMKIQYCKLTEVYSNAGWNNEALLVIKDIVEEITDMEIDYTATVNINGFKEIVDIIGGVEFYVPQRMKYTDKPDDLYIDLHEGLQLLDGDKAEQLVRNRKYYGEVPPDIQRIKVQQDFLIAMTNKILKIRDFDKITNLASTTYDLLDTDFGLLVVNKYVDYLYNLNLKELLTSENMTVLPSYGKKIDGIWYQVWEEEEIKEVIDRVLNK